MPPIARSFADAEKGPMQIAPGQSDISEFESYMPSHAVRSLWGGSQPLQTCGLAHAHQGLLNLAHQRHVIPGEEIIDRLALAHGVTLTPVCAPELLRLPYAARLSSLVSSATA